MCVNAGKDIGSICSAWRDRYVFYGHFHMQGGWKLVNLLL